NFDPVKTIMGQEVNLPDKTTASFNTLNVYLGTTYAVGTQVGEGRILVDILGLNLGYFSADPRTKVSDPKATSVSKLGNHLLVSLNLPLGTQYIFDNGLMLGFRHRLDFAFSSEPKDVTRTVDGTTRTTTLGSGGYYGTGKTQAAYMAYNLTFSIGYAFGK
ncbi:MAG: hypothetical protein ACRC0X_01385, partial [Brevinema sp.]